MSRQAGQRGIRRESHAPDALKLHNLRAVGAQDQTPPPASYLIASDLADWGMLGNGPDPGNLACYPHGAGDCGEAMWGHKRMASAFVANVDNQPTFADGFRPPHTAYTQDLYIAYQHAMGEAGECPDNGTDNLSFFTWLYQQTKTDPGYDLVAFAEVDLTQIPAGWTVADVIHRACVDFRGCCVGVELTEDAEQQFNMWEPWTISSSDPVEPTMGHDIFLGGYGAVPAGLALEEQGYANAKAASDWFVTWGQWQGATVAWDAGAIQDVWVVMTKEDAEAAGYDFDAAVAAIEAMLNGEGPVPSPVPAQGVLGATEDLLEKVEHAIESVPEHVKSALHHAHRLEEAITEGVAVSVISDIIKDLLKAYTHGEL